MTGNSGAYIICCKGLPPSEAPAALGCVTRLCLGPILSGGSIDGGPRPFLLSFPPLLLSLCPKARSNDIRLAVDDEEEGAGRPTGRLGGSTCHSSVGPVVIDPVRDGRIESVCSPFFLGEGAKPFQSIVESVCLFVNLVLVSSYSRYSSREPLFPMAKAFSVSDVTSFGAAAAEIFGANAAAAVDDTAFTAVMPSMVEPCLLSVFSRSATRLRKSSFNRSLDSKFRDCCCCS